MNKQDASIPSSSEAEMSVIIKNEVKRLVTNNDKYIADERNDGCETNKLFSTSYDYSTYENQSYYYPYMYQPHYDDRNALYSYQYQQSIPYMYADVQARNNYPKPCYKGKNSAADTKSGSKKAYKNSSYHNETKKKAEQPKVKLPQKAEKKEGKKKEYAPVKPIIKVEKKQPTPKSNLILEKIKSQLYGINNDPRRAKSKEPDALEDMNDKASLSARGNNIEPIIQSKAKKNAMSIFKFGKKQESCYDFMTRFTRNYNRINSEIEKVKLNRRKMSVDDSSKTDLLKKGGAESETDSIAL